MGGRLTQLLKHLIQWPHHTHLSRDNKTLLPSTRLVPGQDVTMKGSGLDTASLRTVQRSKEVIMGKQYVGFAFGTNNQQEYGGCGVGEMD